MKKLRGFTVILFSISIAFFAGCIGDSNSNEDTDARFTALAPNNKKTVKHAGDNTIIITAELKPSDFGRIMRASDHAIILLPDTLVVVLSQSITPIPNSKEPWRKLLMVEKEGLLIPVDILEEPVIVSNDSRTLRILIDNALDSNTLKKGDLISLNPGAPYVDEQNKSLSPQPVKIIGRNSVGKSELITAWRGGAISGGISEITHIPNIRPIPIRDDISFEIIGYVSTDVVNYWVPPVGISGFTGDIDFSAQTNPKCLDQYYFMGRFPVKCLSSRLVLTDASNGSYTAHIKIFDRLGRPIRTLKQAFGFCGELANPSRRTESGLIMNDLIWNLKDRKGKLVENGVYHWRVSLNFSNGGKWEDEFKMGVYRERNQSNNICADLFQDW